MIRFIRKFLIRQLHDKSFKDQEVAEFTRFLKSERFSDLYSEELDNRVKSTSKMIFNEKLKVVPGLYLFLEKSSSSKQTDPNKVKASLRREVKSTFSNVANHRYFKIIFLKADEQEKLLAHELIAFI